MKPAFYRYPLAYAMELCEIAGVLGILFIAGTIFQEAGVFGGGWQACTLALAGMIPLGIAGFYTGILILWSPLAGAAFWLQGWPFQTGEEVLILRGDHRGKLVKIRTIWDPRLDVRVDLGEEAAKDHKDVLFGIHVCRVGGRKNSMGKKERTANG